MRVLGRGSDLAGAQSHGHGDFKVAIKRDLVMANCIWYR